MEKLPLKIIRPPAGSDGMLLGMAGGLIVPVATPQPKIYTEGFGILIADDEISADTSVLATLESPNFSGTPTGITKAHVGLANVDNTSDLDKPISTATATALSGKEPTIASGTATQYWRGDKSWQSLDKAAVGLADVDNTSDASKPVSTAQAAAIALKLDASQKGAALGVATLDATGQLTLAELPDVITATTQTALDAKLSTATFNAAKGAANGIATLGADGKVPTAQLPDLSGGGGGVTGWASSVTATGTAASQSIQLPETGLVPRDVMVFVNGIRFQTSDYGITGDLLTLTTNAVGDSIEIIKPSGAEGPQGPDGPPLPNGGTTADYLRGDETWQVLNKAAVGLSNVDNTSDANKPTFTMITPGLVPAPVTSTGRFLRDDGTWAESAGGIPQGTMVLDPVSNRTMIFRSLGNGRDGFEAENWHGGPLQYTSTTYTISGDSVYNMVPKVIWGVNGGAGSSAEIRGNMIRQAYFGGSTRNTHFYFKALFGMHAVSSNGYWAIGVTSLFSMDGLQMTSLNSYQQSVLMGIEAADANVSIVYRPGNGYPAQKISLGPNFPGRTSGVDLYRLEIWDDQGTDVINYKVTRVNTGHVAQGTFLSDKIGANDDSARVINMLAQWTKGADNADNVSMGFTAMALQNIIANK